MKKMLFAFIIGALFIGAGVAIAGPPDVKTQSGTGTVVVGGTAPVVDSIGIWDNNGGAWTGASMDPFVEYWIYVNVSDVDTIDNIQYVNVSFYDVGKAANLSISYRYAFGYEDFIPDDGLLDNIGVDGAFTAVVGTLGINQATPANADVDSQLVHSYIFSFTPEKTAHQSTQWSLYAEAEDAQGNTGSLLMTDYREINPYIEMDYVASGGGYNFSWAGGAGSTDLVDTFDVTVTSNGGYTLSSMYVGWWNRTATSYSYTPNLDIGDSPGTASPVTNNTYTDFYTSFTTGPYIVMTSWNIYLSLSANMMQGTYTGPTQPTIYIRGTNS